MTQCSELVESTLASERAHLSLVFIQTLTEAYFTQVNRGNKGRGGVGSSLRNWLLKHLEVGRDNIYTRA